MLYKETQDHYKLEAPECLFADSQIPSDQALCSSQTNFKLTSSGQSPIEMGHFFFPQAN